MKNKKKADLYANSSTAKVLADYLLKKGLSVDTVESTIGCGYHQLEEADFRLKIEAYNRLWDLAIDHTQSPDLGLRLAKNPHNVEMGLVSHVFFNSPTLLAGLKQYERYYALINECMRIELETTDEFAFVKYICKFPEYYHAADVEHSLALSVLRVQQNVKETIKLEAVQFQHQKIAKNSDLYQEIFRCPIEFGKPYSALIFKKSYLDYQLVKRSAYLFKVLSKHIESVYSRFKPPGSFTERVSTVIKKQLSVDCVDAEHIAEKLHMSRHTLYRKLKLEGLAFHDLVDKIREEKAYEYLNSGKHSLSDIAFLLGFSELSAFSRAFKRWTGTSPANYIKNKHA